MREFRVKCMGDRNSLDEFLEDAEKFIRKKQDGEPEPDEAAFKKKRLLEVTESNLKLKKLEFPCMPYKQYTSTYGNPASKENKKRGHNIGYCAGVKVAVLHDLVEKNEHWVAAEDLVSSLRKEEVIDSGSDPESEHEMTNQFNDLLEARSKSEAKTLNSPFLAMVSKYSAGKEQGQRK